MGVSRLHDIVEEIEKLAAEARQIADETLLRFRTGGPDPSQPYTPAYDAGAGGNLATSSLTAGPTGADPATSGVDETPEAVSEPASLGLDPAAVADPPPVEGDPVNLGTEPVDAPPPTEPVASPQEGAL